MSENIDLKIIWRGEDSIMSRKWREGNKVRVVRILGGSSKYYDLIDKIGTVWRDSKDGAIISFNGIKEKMELYNGEIIRTSQLEEEIRRSKNG